MIIDDLRKLGDGAGMDDGKNGGESGCRDNCRGDDRGTSGELEEISVNGRRAEMEEVDGKNAALGAGVGMGVSVSVGVGRGVSAGGGVGVGRGVNVSVDQGTKYAVGKTFQISVIEKKS
jgi:hypothetical protein